MTPENTELIQKSICTLVFTLKNIEVKFYSAQHSISISNYHTNQLSLFKAKYVIFLLPFIIIPPLQNISSDVLGFTGDEATRQNLKLLIKSLSRLL